MNSLHGGFPFGAASKRHLSKSTVLNCPAREGSCISKNIFARPGPHDLVTLIVPLDFEDGRTNNPRRGKSSLPLRLRSNDCAALDISRRFAHGTKQKFNFSRSAVC